MEGLAAANTGLGIVGWRYVGLLAAFMLGTGVAAVLMGWLYYVTVQRRVRAIRRELDLAVRQQAHAIVQNILWGKGDSKETERGGDA